MLVSEVCYAADGTPAVESAPDNRGDWREPRWIPRLRNPKGETSAGRERVNAVTETTRDRAGRILRTVEALGTPAERVTRFRWHASGQMSHLILENPATGEQVTTWTFGTTLVVHQY